MAADSTPERLTSMATFVLIHGAGDAGWYWHLTEAELRARRDDPLISYYNGIPRPLAEEALRQGGRGESSVVWDTPWPLDAWPDVPTKFILCQDDQFFPAAFLRRVAQQRLGIVPDEVPGGHCVALSHPRELSNLLASYLD